MDVWSWKFSGVRGTIATQVVSQSAQTVSEALTQRPPLGRTAGNRSSDRSLCIKKFSWTDMLLLPIGDTCSSFIENSPWTIGDHLAYTLGKPWKCLGIYLAPRWLLTRDWGCQSIQTQLPCLLRDNAEAWLTLQCSPLGSCTFLYTQIIVSVSASGKLDLRHHPFFHWFAETLMSDIKCPHMH